MNVTFDLVTGYSAGTSVLMEDTDGIDWPRLLDISRHHRLTPLLYKMLKGQPGVPENILAKLHGLILHHTVATVRSVEQLKSVLSRAKLKSVR